MKGIAENPENGERLGYFRKPEIDVSDFLPVIIMTSITGHTLRVTKIFNIRYNQEI